MAAQNRTDLSATLAALAAVVDLSELKAVLANFIDSMLMKRDVQNTITATGAGFINVDFANYDVIKLSTAYNVQVNVQNIADGDVKYLYIQKTAADLTIQFSSASNQSIDTDYLKTISDIVYMVTKKSYSNVLVIPLVKSVDIDAISPVKLAYFQIGSWDMDANQSSSPIATGIAYDKIIGVEAMIKPDNLNVYHPINSANSSFELQGAVKSVDTSGNVLLWRKTGGMFDSTIYDDTGINRGYIKVAYIL